MRKIVHKWFWGWDFDKEEKWLNEMAAKGLALVSVSFCKYEFEHCLPGEYAVRMELLDHFPGHPESEQYIAFIEESGAEQAGSFSRWVYFRKNRAEGEFELFSDNDSRIRHLKSILYLLGLIFGLNLYIFLYNLFIFSLYNNPISLIAIVNLIIALLCALGFWRLYKKKKYLEKEKVIYE